MRGRRFNVVECLFSINPRGGGGGGSASVEWLFSTTPLPCALREVTHERDAPPVARRADHLEVDHGAVGPVAVGQCHHRHAAAAALLLMPPLLESGRYMYVRLT